jgi:hypothetical protein
MKKHLGRIVFFMLLSLFLGLKSQAQEEKFKAIFIYNFTKYIEWSATDNSEFTIAIVGKSAIEQELKNIASKMKVGNKTIVVKTYSSVGEIKNAQIIYISDKNTNLAEAVTLSKNIKSLLISNIPNSCKQGACITFITKNGNLSFEISEKNIKQCGLLVNSSLIALGTSID